MSSEPKGDGPSSVTSPGDLLGFKVGTDRRLADRPQVVEYLKLLADQSDRVVTTDLGKTTEGNPFLLSCISSPGNIRDLERYRDIQRQLSDPRKIPDSREAPLISEARAVVAITCSIHATEVGGTQMALELAYQLATPDDPEVRRILDNVILLLVPSLNPDGLIKVKRWYDATLDTHYEGATPPFLYHRYAGHDNNRDWFMFTQAETRLLVQHVHNAWRPHITYDIHQTRSDGMRMILPPLLDPVGPNVDPILQSELASLGTHMAARMTAEGKGGVAVNVVYDSYSPSRSYPHYHAGIRALSEAASVRIASPVEIERRQLKSDRGERPTVKSWNHPMPWKGGAWTLMDIVDYNLTAAMACLDNAARNRDTWVRNSFAVLKRAVSDQRNHFAFVIPAQQHDPGAAEELIELLQFADVEVHELQKDGSHEGVRMDAGDRIVLTRQPYGSFAQTMLETQRYPDIRRYPGGPPRHPYDATAHSLPLKMGVEAREISAPVDVEVRPLPRPLSKNGRSAETPGAPVFASGRVYAIPPNSNDAARLVNSLLAEGVPVSRTRRALDTDDSPLPAGTFLVAPESDVTGSMAASAPGLRASIRELGRELDVALESDAQPLTAPRIGIYRGYVPSTEEGWTRFVLDDYRFSYRSLTSSDVRDGGLAADYDVVLLPHQAVRQIHRGFNAASYAPEYSGGLGDTGAASLREFAGDGGTLVAWDDAARYCIRHLELPVTNVLAGLTHSEFFAPGSLLEIGLDTEDPIGWGMPRRAAALFMSGPAFRCDDGRAIASYAAGDPLLSGWLIGPDKIAGQGAIVRVPIGEGQVVLFGFRPHFRAQARGTYKLLFNALYASVARQAKPAQSLEEN